MISPHLLKVVESHSTSLYKNLNQAKVVADTLWGNLENRPRFIIKPTTKNPTWCHMVLAHGPVLGSDLDWEPKGSELVIVWWSEMGPDTDRVLSSVDWKKHARNYE